MLKLSLRIDDMLVITDRDGNHLLIRVGEVARSAQRVVLKMHGPQCFAIRKIKRTNLGTPHRQDGDRADGAACGTFGEEHVQD